MVRLYFEYRNAVKFIEISSETHRRLKIHTLRVNASLQLTIRSIRKKYGAVTEKLIIRYLDEA